MELFYQQERDKDFFHVCESIRKEYGSSYISVTNIAKEAVFRKAESFYIHPNHYIRIIHIMKKKKDSSFLKNKEKRRLYSEIYYRYLDLNMKNPELSVIDIATIISKQEAPRFYMSELRGRNLYYKLLKK